MIKDIIENTGNEAWPNGQNRPLGTLSNFVVEELPSWTAVIDGPADCKLEQMSAYVSRLVSLEKHWLDWKNYEPVGLLDLKMIYMVTTVVQKHFENGFKGTATGTLDTVRQELGAKIREASVALGRPPLVILTYEDIVLKNPRGDTRVFTTGDKAVSERAFYVAHQQIEVLAEQAIENVRSVVGEGFNAEAAPRMIAANGAVEKVVQGMRTFITELDRSHFATFKDFFANSPYTGEKGPSGAFSAKMQHIDILMYGADVPASTTNYLTVNRDYFPPEDLAALEETRTAGKSLLGALSSSTAPIAERQMFLSMASLMRTFRQFHMGAVKKHHGEMLVGSAESGDAKQFLQGRIDEYAAAYAMAEDKLFPWGPDRPIGLPGSANYPKKDRGWMS